MTILGLEAHWELDVVSQELEMEKSFLTCQEIQSNSGLISSGQ